MVVSLQRLREMDKRDPFRITNFVFCFCFLQLFIRQHPQSGGREALSIPFWGFFYHTEIISIENPDLSYQKEFRSKNQIDPDLSYQKELRSKNQIERDPKNGSKLGPSAGYVTS